MKFKVSYFNKITHALTMILNCERDSEEAAVKQTDLQFEQFRHKLSEHYRKIENADLS